MYRDALDFPRSCDQSSSASQLPFDNLTGMDQREVATMAGEPILFTVGHSNTSAERLLEILRSQGVEVVADVRTYPRSQYVPHFDAAPFQEFLRMSGIGYAFLGVELGGRPEGNEFYDDEDYVLYDRVARADFFNAGIERLLIGAQRYRVAILCSEEDPCACHRHLLIGRVLAERRVDVTHIRHNGATVQDSVLQGLANGAGGAQSELFGTGRVEWKSVRSVSRRKAHARSLTS